MNVNQKNSQPLAREVPGVLPDGTTPSEMFVQALADRLAQLTDCRGPASMPPPCSPALDAWLVTQMSDAQFLEFRIAYEKWVEEQRKARSGTDFRVELTPRPSMCDCGPVSTPVPKGGPIPAMTSADAASAS